MAETYGDYFRGLGRSIGQGVTFGFGDEIEAGIRALGPETYDEEVAKIRADLEKFRETNPVSAFAGELAGAVPTAVAGGAGLASLGIRGAARIGAVEGALYGAGTGESAEGRALGAALGAPTGAVAGKVGEKAMEGIAPMVGKFMKRGSGSEIRGATDIQLDAAEQPRATVFDVETGVTSPLEKTVGEPRTSDLGPGGINPVTKDPLLGPFTADYSPIENALANAERVMNASPTKGLTGEQYLARLVEQPSVTKTEMNASGLASFLSRPENKRRKIPVAEVQQYMKENAPKIETVKYTSDDNNVTYRDTQRFMDESAYSEVGYGEITTNNRNAHPATLGHPLSHYRDQLGNFAHVRYSDHKDASGGVSRVIEENQFDLLQSLLSQERGGALSRITPVKLTPEKVADYDARIEKLRASPEYPIFRQTGDDLVEAGSRLRSAEEAQRGLIEQRDNISKKRGNKARLSSSQLRNAGLARAEAMELGAGKLPGVAGSDETLIQMVMPDFIENTVFRAIRSIEAENAGYSPSSDEISQIITRSINSTPEQLVSEIIEAAKKRGQNVPRIAPVAKQRIAAFASKYATPAEKTMLLASSRIQSDAVFTFKEAFGQQRLDLGFSIDDANSFSQEEASRIIRENAAKAMSAPRQLKVMSDILAQDRVKVLNLDSEINSAIDRVDAAKKAKANAAMEFESASKKLVRNNTAITGLIDKVSAADTRGFFEYAQKTNFLPREANPVDPAGRAQLVPNQPFDTPLQAARHNIMVTIRDAANEGVDRIYFPDYRDLAKIREVNPEGFFKTVYKDAPEKVIKELKQKFPDLKTGRISPDEFVGNHLDEIGDEAEVTQPVLYIDISRASIDRLGIPRRYAKGGQVDLRSGIGNMFRLYS